MHEVPVDVTFAILMIHSLSLSPFEVIIFSTPSFKACYAIVFSQASNQISQAHRIRCQPVSSHVLVFQFTDNRHTRFKLNVKRI